MPHHEKCDPKEIFLGNTRRNDDRLAFFTSRGLRTIRMGNVAYDIDGKPLPDSYAPLFIQRAEQEAHHAIMMEHAHGPDWRRMYA